MLARLVSISIASFVLWGNLSLAQTAANADSLLKPAEPASPNVLTRLGFTEELLQVYQTDPEQANLLVLDRELNLRQGIQSFAIKSNDARLQANLRAAAGRIEQAFTEASEVLTNPNERAKGYERPSPALPSDVDLLAQNPEALGKRLNLRDPDTGETAEVEIEGAKGVRMDPEKIGRAIRRGSGSIARFGGNLGAFYTAMAIETFLTCLKNPEISPTCLQDFFKNNSSLAGALGFGGWYITQQLVTNRLLKISEMHPGSRNPFYSRGFAMATGMWFGYLAVGPLMDFATSENGHGCAKGFLRVYGPQSPEVLAGAAMSPNPPELPRQLNVVERQYCSKLKSEFKLNFADKYLPAFVSLTGSALIYAGGSYLLFDLPQLSTRLTTFLFKTRGGRALLNTARAGGRMIRIGRAVGSYVMFLYLMDLIANDVNVNQYVIRHNMADWGWGVPAVSTTEAKLLDTIAHIKYDGIANSDELMQKEEILKAYAQSLQLWRTEELIEIANLRDSYDKKLGPMNGLAVITKTFYDAAIKREALTRLGSVPDDAKKDYISQIYNKDDDTFMAALKNDFGKLDAAVPAGLIKDLSDEARAVGPFRAGDLLDYLVVMMACGPEIRFPDKTGKKQSVVNTPWGLPGWTYHFVPPKLLTSRPDFCNGSNTQHPLPLNAFTGEGKVTNFVSVSGPDIESFEWYDEKGVERKGLLSYVMHYLPNSVLNLNEPQPFNKPALMTLARVTQPHERFWIDEVDPQIGDIYIREMDRWEKYMRENGLRLYTRPDYQYCRGAADLKGDGSVDCKLERKLAMSNLDGIRDEVARFSRWILELSDEKLVDKYHLDIAELERARTALMKDFNLYIETARKMAAEANDKTNPTPNLSAYLKALASTTDSILEDRNTFRKNVAQFVSNFRQSPLRDVKSPDNHIASFVTELSVQIDNATNELVNEMTLVIPQFVDRVVTPNPK